MYGFREAFPVAALVMDYQSVQGRIGSFAAEKDALNKRAEIQALDDAFQGLPDQHIEQRKHADKEELRAMSVYLCDRCKELAHPATYQRADNNFRRSIDPEEGKENQGRSFSYLTLSKEEHGLKDGGDLIP
jgi:hypothetical protein